MDINDALVDKLALLSRLQFSETERTSIKADLGRMISFVDKLNGLDTSGIEPMLHISKNANVLREDVVMQESTREDALLNAPLAGNGFFKVPKVIKK